MLRRKTEDIEELLAAVRDACGTHSVVPYGDSDDPCSLGFRIEGIAVTFSVLTDYRLAERHYDVQVESYPSNELDYLYHTRAISLWGFVGLVKLMLGPKHNWPR